ncbi:MAG TPA: glucosamine-6-phosphate deaminase [Solibacterales bacterium]|nr:glucosamine-6-phosphate deaminase [Bryobacterales bacterium]
MLRFDAGRLSLEVHYSRVEMGRAAAAAAAPFLRGPALFASAASQVECLGALRQYQTIDWPAVSAFHLDEYVGMGPDHPASFRRFIREHLLDHVPVKGFDGLTGEAPDPEAECARYARLLDANPPQVCILGVGENGHLAFNDPPVARFDDPLAVKVVDLDLVCREQQVHDGAFASLADVPMKALTVSVRRIMQVPRLVVVVPGPRKAAAIRAALEGPITTECPASILRTHPNAALFLDRDSASLLSATAGRD